MIPSTVSSSLAGSSGYSGLTAVTRLKTNPRFRSAWVTVDAGLHSPGDVLRCLYCSAPEPQAPLPVADRNGRAVLVELPPGGVGIYAP